MVLCCYEDSSSSSSSSESRAYNVQATVTHKRKAGRKKFKETRHPIYRCVRERNGNKWVCEVREPNKKNSRIWLGTYSTPEMAARAYDVAALALRGDSAPLNFPDSAWLLPRPNSSAIKDIQATASEAAQAFAPTSTKINFSASSSSTSSSSTTAFVKLQHAKTLKELSEIFWDDEAFFNTPILLDSMAEGLLLSPPSTQHNSFDWNEVDWNMDFSLWSN